MHRVVGLTLTGLGAFFIALALLSRFYLPGQVVKYPLNEYYVSTLVGHDMSYFSAKQLKVLSGVTMRATSTVQGDVAAGSSSTAVWEEITGVEDVTNHQPVSYSSQRSALDRRTGALVNCCGARVGTNTTVVQSGQGFTWPFSTEQRTYQVFDPILLKPEPFTYQGTTTIDGLTTYKFVEQVNNQQYGTLTVPGSLIGSSQASVTLPEELTETNTFYVDPVTGAPLSVSENQTQTLADSTGATKLLLFQGDLASTPASVQAAVDNIKTPRFKISLVQGIGPIIEAILGIVLLVIGLAVIVAGRDREEPDGGDDDDELSAERGEPEDPAVQREASAVDPEASAVAPEASAAAPEGSAVAPEGSAVAPEGSAAEPEGSAVAPETSTLEPEASAAEPKASTVAPEGSTA